jgi:hypothetical protein
MTFQVTPQQGTGENYLNEGLSAYFGRMPDGDEEGRYI